jgi:hypothetical protein
MFESVKFIGSYWKKLGFLSKGFTAKQKIEGLHCHDYLSLLIESLHVRMNNAPVRF